MAPDCVTAGDKEETASPTAVAAELEFVGTEDRRTIIEHEEHTQGFPATNAAATNACILACYSLISAQLEPNEVHTWLFYSRSSWQLTPAITRAHVRTSS